MGKICQKCRKVKTTRQKKSAICRFSVPSEIFRIDHIDLDGPLTRNGPRKILHKYILNIFAHKDLYSSRHDFLRIDRVRKQLEPSYEGPLEVINRSSKIFSINIKATM